MANEGWAMKSFFAGVFTFEPCEKGEYQYQIDFCDKALHLSDGYREFMADNKLFVVGNETLIRENENLFGTVESLL